MPVKPVPDGYHSLQPYIICRDAAQAIAFYRNAFGAVELVRMPDDEGKIGHAELRIGDSILMLSDEHLERDIKSPATLGGSPVSLMIYVEDVDATFINAVAAGGKIKREPADQFYGDRSAGVEDPFGHTWWIHTHIEDVTPEEMKRRMTQQK
jgi:PhnB protein